MSARFCFEFAQNLSSFIASSHNKSFFERDAFRQQSFLVQQHISSGKFEPFSSRQDYQDLFNFLVPAFHGGLTVLFAIQAAMLLLLALCGGDPLVPKQSRMMWNSRWERVFGMVVLLWVVLFVCVFVFWSDVNVVSFATRHGPIGLYCILLSLVSWMSYALACVLSTEHTPAELRLGTKTTALTCCALLALLQAFVDLDTNRQTAKSVGAGMLLFCNAFQLLVMFPCRSSAGAHLSASTVAQSFKTSPATRFSGSTFSLQCMNRVLSLAEALFNSLLALSTGWIGFRQNAFPVDWSWFHCQDINMPFFPVMSILQFVVLFTVILNTSQLLISFFVTSSSFESFGECSRLFSDPPFLTPDAERKQSQEKTKPESGMLGRLAQQQKTFVLFTTNSSLWLYWMLQSKQIEEDSKEESAKTIKQQPQSSCCCSCSGRRKYMRLKSAELT